MVKRSNGAWKEEEEEEEKKKTTGEAGLPA